MINATFAERLITAYNAPADNPVHMLFNQWWNEAPVEVTKAYVDQLMADPRYRTFIEDAHFAEPLDLAELSRMAPGTLGRCYHDWIVDNGLTAAIATNYRHFHDSLDRTGQLDGMPTEMRFAILRGFQVHDFLHVLSGYNSSGRGEIALQAFSLAQFPFPYFGMWMSVVTTRMTYHDPTMIVPIMDAISDGWQYGRSTPNLMVEPWESMLDEPLGALRERFGIVLSPLAQAMSPAHSS